MRRPGRVNRSVREKQGGALYVLRGNERGYVPIAVGECCGNFLRCYDVGARRDIERMQYLVVIARVRRLLRHGNQVHDTVSTCCPVYDRGGRNSDFGIDKRAT